MRCSFGLNSKSRNHAQTSGSRVRGVKIVSSGVKLRGCDDDILVGVAAQVPNQLVRPCRTGGMLRGP